MRAPLAVLCSLILSFTSLVALPADAVTVSPSSLQPNPASHFADSGSKSGLRLHDTGDGSRLFPMDVRLVDSSGNYVAIGSSTASGPTAIVVDPSTLQPTPMSFISDSGAKAALRLHDTGDGSRLYPVDVRLVDSSGNYVNAAGGGGGGGTIATISAGPNIVVTNPSGPNTTIGTTQSPTFTGSTTLGVSGTYGDSGSNNGILALGTGAGGNYTRVFSSNQAANQVNTISGTLLAVANGTAVPVAVVDASGNTSIKGSLYSSALTAGQCLAAGTSGKVQTTGSACATGTISQINAGANTVVIVCDLSPHHSFASPERYVI